MPLKLVERPDARGVFMERRDTFAATPRKADYFWTTLGRVLSFGKNRGRISVNVCERGGRLYKADRREKIWSESQVAIFLKVASPELRLALLMALWTGQRQGDLLRATWSAVDDGHLRLRQSKTKAHVSVPLFSELKVALEEARKREAGRAEKAASKGHTHTPAVTILTNSRGEPWTSDGFRTSWGKACDLAGVEGVTFHDLRGTAVTRLSLAGCSVPEIAGITGHSLRNAEAILNANYLGGGAERAKAAMRKLEKRTRSVKPGVKRSVRSPKISG
jgi:integrase